MRSSDEDSKEISSSDEDSEDESLSEDDDEDDEDEMSSVPLVWRIIMLRRHKRSFYYQPKFDRQIACYVLNNYMKSSTYCGVRTSASQIYDLLQCSVSGSPLEPTTTTVSSRTAASTSAATTTTPPPPPPPTTTTTTPRATTRSTTAAPTTTTRRTTTTQRSTTTTRATTITSSPTTTTTTAALTTTTTAGTAATPTTQPTTTAAPAQCGASSIATRSAAVTSSSLFISPRVVGGRIAGTCTTYPWMVRLSINNGQVCGGSILDERHILTAGHCVVNKNKIRATIGEYDTSKVEGTEQVFDVSPATGVSVHPEFDYFAKKNDVAVLTLDESIDFDQICAAPICLNPNYKITSGQSCTIAGWGATSENARVSSTTLQEVSVPTYPGRECSSVFSTAEASYFTDPSKQLCAGQPNIGGVDSCSGDSGGPLMCEDKATSTWVQVGVVSYGEGCARANNPGVYTEVRAHHDWIQQQIIN